MTWPCLLHELLAVVTSRSLEISHWCWILCKAPSIYYGQKRLRIRFVSEFYKAGLNQLYCLLNKITNCHYYLICALFRLLQIQRTLQLGNNCTGKQKSPSTCTRTKSRYRGQPKTIETKKDLISVSLFLSCRYTCYIQMYIHINSYIKQCFNIVCFLITLNKEYVHVHTLVFMEISFSWSENNKYKKILKYFKHFSCFVLWFAFAFPLFPQFYLRILFNYSLSGQRQLWYRTKLCNRAKSNWIC